jgi:dehydrogenase/reductase SDR family protein 7B
MVDNSTQRYFNDKVVWITGASSGIGRALCLALRSSGAWLIVSARQRQALDEIRAAYGENKVHVVVLDQASPESVKQASAQALAWKGRVDVLFNNGGISQRSEAVDTDESVVRRIMEVNFFANIQLTAAVLPGMIERGSGHVVVTSSLMGKWGFYLRSAYGASKHALHGYYDSLRMEVESQGIQVTILTPGFIATDISRNALSGDGKPTGEMDQNQAGGMPVELCADKILQGVARGATELPIGGKELNGLWVKRFFPKLFERILRRQQAR